MVDRCWTVRVREERLRQEARTTPARLFTPWTARRDRAEAHPVAPPVPAPRPDQLAAEG